MILSSSLPSSIAPLLRQAITNAGRRSRLILAFFLISRQNLETLLRKIIETDEFHTTQDRNT
jgi:hypothetical protein